MSTRLFGAVAIAVTFGVGLMVGPGAVVSTADAGTVYNFNKPQPAKKRVVRRVKRKKAEPGFFFSPACLIPGGGGVVCAHQTLTKKKN